jgi:hypothetical protein
MGNRLSAVRECEAEACAQRAQSDKSWPGSQTAFGDGQPGCSRPHSSGFACRQLLIPDPQQVLPLPQFTLESLEEIPKAYDRVAEGKGSVLRVQQKEEVMVSSWE